MDPRLHDYYEARFAEAERLARREGQIEVARTKELLSRHLPSSGVRVLDIGGGTGIYATWLAGLGHDVHLIDVVPLHVHQAARVGTFTTSVGDARSLPAPDASYDAALLLGPMYHLLDPEDRATALGEAVRVLKSGGLLAISYISRLAVVLDGYVKGWIYGERGRAALEEVVRHGSDPGGQGFGPIAYFHQASEIRSELKHPDLEILGTFGIEGPGWIDADFDARWDRQADREALLHSARACEALPEFQGLSSHILAVARKSTRALSAS